MGFFDWVIPNFNKKPTNKSPKDTGGPVVKTGPTKGDNRSRNNDGQWRKMRTDSK